MDRREFLRATGAVTAGTAGTAFAGEAAADHDGDETNPTPADGTTAYESKVTTVRKPLSGVPAVVSAGDTLRVELDADADVGATPRAFLVASFGSVEPEVELDHRATRTGEDSAIWNRVEDEDATVTVAEYRVPGFGDGPRGGRAYTPGLYDLRVEWPGGSDSQPRAVRVYESVPDRLDVAVVADPQIADPRAVESGVEESRNERTPEPFVTRTRRLTGDSPQDRWEAARRAVAEVNALDPDLVLVAGDITFGQDAPGKYYAEYEDAWTILNRLRAPSFCTIGNHDGYVQSGVDGKALYRETFGPPSYSVDVGGLHLVAVDTYDWSYLDRAGASAAVSSWGGQVRDRQFEWLADDLESWRADNPDGTVVAFGHHNPSWQWDGDHEPAERTRGTPVAEQFGRGTRFFTTGQGWTGRRHQFDLRELFDRTGVSAFFAGHSHRDRVARYVTGAGVAGEHGDIVETPGPNTPPDGRYHYVEYVDRDGDGRPEGKVVDSGPHLADDLTDESLTPLYVNTTTAASGTGEYWGWRPLALDATSGEVTIDSDEYGYPVTRAFLDDRAVNPENWNPDHDEVGLYSHPSYLLSVSRERTGTGVEITVENRLATPASGAVLVTVEDCAGVRVENGDVVWRRRGDDEQVVKAAYEVAPESELVMSVECVSEERR